jgi:hypothetical protein
MWKPLAAGACGAALVVLAAAAGAYAIVPTFRPKVVEIPVLDVTHQPVVVPEVTMKPVTVPDISTYPVEIPVPRVVEAEHPVSRETAPALTPRSPAESRFEASPEWKGAVVRGRILRPALPNGMVLATEAGEQSFYPARTGPKGPEPDPTKRDDITGLEGRLAVCREAPTLLYICVSLGPGGEEVIPQLPVLAGEPL